MNVFPLMAAIFERARAVPASLGGFVGVCALTVVAVIASPGCRSPAEPTRVVVFGVDGLDWQVVLPLLRDNRLPNLARLMGAGSSGRLRTFIPTDSPLIWTSVATGKVPKNHGILSFARRTEDGGLELYDNADRTTKAVWNIASDHGRRVSVIGWWMTYPVERVNGVMVAQTNTIDQLDTRAGKNVWKGTILRGVPGQVYPVDRQNEVMEILEATDAALPSIERQIFGEFRHPMSRLGQTLWNNCRWAVRADTVYLDIALRLAGESPRSDLTLVYFGGTDVVGHRFWRYLDPDAYSDPPSPREIEEFGAVIPSYYRYMDFALGQLIEAYGLDTHYLVMSDHGMHPTNTDARFDPDDPPVDINSAAHEDGPPGVLIVSGPHIRETLTGRPLDRLTHDDLPPLGTVLDVAPTILALLQLPVGRDMDGQVLADLLREDFLSAHPVQTVDSHDSPDFAANRGLVEADRSDQQRLEQLRSLGYIAD